MPFDSSTLTGARVEYTYLDAQTGLPAVVTTGTVVEVKTYKRQTYLLIQPDAARMLPRWRTRFDIRTVLNLAVVEAA